MTPTSDRHPHEQGFTLIELLVAITLLGLLMAALFGGLRLGVRVWDTSEARLEQFSRLQVAQDFLRERVGQAYPLREAAGKRQTELSFQGTDAALRFVTLLPDHLEAGYSQLTIGLDEQPERRDLVVEWRPFDPVGAATDTGDEPQRKALLTDIADLRISYYGALDRRQAPSWQAEWREATQLPYLVRIQVGFAPDDRRLWPDLIVRLRVDGLADAF